MVTDRTDLVGAGDGLAPAHPLKKTIEARRAGCRPGRASQLRRRGKN
jgi:hypothetical protein